MKLRKFVWWPNEWTKDDLFSGHNTVLAQRVRQGGFLAACKLTRHVLLMEVDHCGETVVGRVAQPSFNAPADMRGLRDFLLLHIGASMGEIEDLDVDPDRFNVIR